MDFQEATEKILQVTVVEAVAQVLQVLHIVKTQ
jgi:hypothetical protein